MKGLLLTFWFLINVSVSLSAMESFEQFVVTMGVKPESEPSYQEIDDLLLKFFSHQPEEENIRFKSGSEYVVSFPVSNNLLSFSLANSSATTFGLDVGVNLRKGELRATKTELIADQFIDSTVNSENIQYRVYDIMKKCMKNFVY